MSRATGTSFAAERVEGRREMLEEALNLPRLRRSVQPGCEYCGMEPADDGEYIRYDALLALVKFVSKV